MVRTGSPPSVVARALTVSYGGKDRGGPGLKGFTASFRPGITGLAGPNGAGKTTFLRTALGLLTPSSGTLEILGRPPEAFRAYGGAGFLPEVPPLPRYLSVREFLEGLVPGAAASAPGTPVPVSLPPHLDPLLDRPMGSLSMGQRKSVALTASLLGEPSVLLLDEPTNGLDPGAVRTLRDTLLAVKDRGATIIVSSHHLDELQRISDALVFIREGEAVGEWARDAALAAFGNLETLFYHLFEGKADGLHAS